MTVIQNQDDFIKSVQRLPIQWISHNIKDEKKLEMRHKELNEFLVNFSNGPKNMFGEISYNRLMNYLGKHIGAHQIPGNKLNRSIVKSSRRIYL